MRTMTKKFKSLYASALTVGPFCCIELVNDWQPRGSMRFWSVKKDLCCDNTNIFLIPPLKYKVLQNPNLLKVDFGKLNAVMSCQRTISHKSLSKFWIMFWIKLALLTTTWQILDFMSPFHVHNHNHTFC